MARHLRRVGITQQFVVDGEIGRRDRDRGLRRSAPAAHGRARCFEIGYAAGVEHGVEVIGERRLAALHGGEMQQADIDAASLARIEPLVERLPGTAEGARGNSSSRNTECRNACGFLISAPIRWR